MEMVTGEGIGGASGREDGCGVEWMCRIGWGQR